MSQKIQKELSGVRIDTTSNQLKAPRMKIPFMLTRDDKNISLSLGDPKTGLLLSVDIKSIAKELLEILSQETN
ncbi:hypothetical protein [Erysipelothrix aquatica]|uniref:hypothetical protein n=1 Tax=Erysipelothrix aquatica TaxID=2683714 RepID=UPI0013584571|nr:hypothetical protein [Erysipelothrix aquatica]